MSHRLALDGRDLPIVLRRNARARRLSLRLDHGREAVVVVLPRGVAVAEALRFAAAQHDWIRSRLDALPPRVAFADGAVVPLLGIATPIRHRPEARRGVWQEDGALHVSGAAEFLARRVCDWLQGRAGAEVAARAHPMAARLGRPIGRIGLRDPRSRWGSCTAAGDLSFSWRLVMAPTAVLDYVVAHEVAHLVELNHGAAFWRVVAALLPDYAAPQRWLKRHGPALHRYG